MNLYKKIKNRTLQELNDLLKKILPELSDLLDKEPIQENVKEEILGLVNGTFQAKSSFVNYLLLDVFGDRFNYISIKKENVEYPNLGNATLDVEYKDGEWKIKRSFNMYKNLKDE